MQKKAKKVVSASQPEILEMKTQKMAVVYTKGDPNKVAEKVMPALYSAVYKLKFKLKKEGRIFEVGKLRARWPDAHLVPKNQWTGIWGLPVPEDTKELFQKIPEVQVKLERWEYRTVAQITHLGPYASEGPTIEKLKNFIAESGYQILGHHEEEYLTTPKAKIQKTIIRYPIRKTN